MDTQQQVASGHLTPTPLIYAVQYLVDSIKESLDCEAADDRVGSYLLVSGLKADPHMGDPLADSDGDGRIYFLGRRGSSESQAACYDALGLNHDGTPALEAPAVCDELARIVQAELKANRPLRATLQNMLRRHGRTLTVAEAVRSACGDPEVTDGVTNAFTRERWFSRLSDEDQNRLYPLVTLMERGKEQAWASAREKGTLGNRFAVLLDVYEHGGVVLSLAGEGTADSWDTSRGGAVWVPDPTAIENIQERAIREAGLGQVRWFGAYGSQAHPLHARYSLDGGVTWHGRFNQWSEAQKGLMDALVANGHGAQVTALKEKERAAAEAYARGVLVDYNAWLAGDCYGICTYVLNAETGQPDPAFEAEAWGYIGQEKAATELAAVVDRTKALLAKNAAH